MKYGTVFINNVKNIFRGLLSKSSWILPKYRVNKCRSYSHRDLVDFKNPYALEKPLQAYYDELINKVKDKLNKGEKYSVIRLDDGEAYFLRNELHGNIIKRHLTEQNYTIERQEWISEYQRNDLKAYNINKELRKLWYPIIGKEELKDFFPLHAVYCLVATKNIFNLKEGIKIGLIGSENKLEIIQKLMRYEEYQDYLGIKDFYEYIKIPEKGAANNPELLYDQIIQQTSGKSDIYLVGMGLVKLKILAKIRDELDTIIIDIGAGIDAIAGLAPKDSRMFGTWTNYKLKEYNYKEIDVLSTKLSGKVLNRFSISNDIKL